MRPVSFTDYETQSAAKSEARGGEREFGPDVMQLLYVANRFEWRRASGGGWPMVDFVICAADRASSVAYGEARAWTEVGRIFSEGCRCLDTGPLDIAPPTAAERKAPGATDERDLALLGRSGPSYQRRPPNPDGC